MNVNGKVLRVLVMALITIAMLTIAFWLAGIENVYRDLARFPTLGVTVVLILFGLNLVVVTFRLMRILVHFGLDIPASIVAKANISGHVASLFFISLFGQVAGRHLVLNQASVPSVIIASLTAYERAMGLIISGGLCILGATILLDSLTINNYLAQIPISEIIIAAGGSLVLSLWFGRSKFESRMISRVISWARLNDVFEIFTITIIGRLLVMTAFVISASLLNPGLNYIPLFAAAAVTSFAANLPVTIHGWGLRELAAVYTLGLLGIPSSEALAVSILIGLSSTAVVLMASPFTLMKTNKKNITRKSGIEKMRKNGFEVEKSAAWMISMAAAILVFFQIHVEFQGGLINLNLADPFAILAAAAIITHITISRKLPSWRISNFNLILAAITLLLLFAFVRGLPEIGVTQWALANRLTGWLVLLGYLSAGYYIVSYFGRHGFRRLSETMIITAVIIVTVRILLRSFNEIGWIELIDLPYRFQAYAGNRNAFAFQMLACSVLLLGYSSVYIRVDRHLKGLGADIRGYIARFFSTLKINENTHLIVISLLHGVILVGIILSGSRAGLITGAVLLITAIVMKLAERRMIGFSILFALLILVMTKLGTGLLAYGSGVMISEHSDTERWETIIRGFYMWLESPLIGKGLGVFIEESTSWSKRAINIHSTPVWILAEFGLLGIAIFTWVILIFARFFYKNGLVDPAHRVIVMLILVFIIFGLVHEIFYQRIFWLVLGAAMALSGKTNLAPHKVR